MENDYNFSMQFTADLIAMNSSDFQITSTFQEIAGTETTVGQYEPANISQCRDFTGSKTE